jgi:hypothetical protein
LEDRNVDEHSSMDDSNKETYTKQIYKNDKIDEPTEEKTDEPTTHTHQQINQKHQTTYSPKQKQKNKLHKSKTEVNNRYLLKKYTI